MEQIASILRERRSDGQPALIAETDTYSYARLWEAIDCAAAKLQEHGVRPGSKVVVALSNTPAFPVVLMALSQIGAVSIPLDPSMAEKERARIFAIAQPGFVAGFHGQQRVSPGAYLSRVHGAVHQEDVELEGASTILFTSGTTGSPKGVLLSGDALLGNARAVVDYLRLTADDRTLIFLPLFYSYPLSQMLTTWLAGGAVVLMKNLMFPAHAIKLIDRHAVTGFGGVPTSLSLLANLSKGPDRALRYVMNAGGLLPPPLARKLEAAFPGAAVFNNYGCTEIGPRATAVNYREHADRIGSIGRPISGVDLRLIRPDLSEAAPMETAEIVLSGPTMMKGYYRDPETTAACMSKWGFHTGDYAYADADGFLYFQGRRDDIFKCGGEKVSAREIEDVMLEHQGVLEVAVVAQPDALLGLVPIAYVVRAEEGGPTQDDLQMFCRRKLSLHKVPKRVQFIDKLDRTANGKIQKFRLPDAASNEAAV